MAPKWIRAIGSFFLGIGKGIGRATVKFLNSKELKELLRTTEGQVVQAVILELNAENAGLDNHAWRAEVVKRVEEKFKGAGLTFKDSLVRMLMENISARLKGLE